jgi:hypothetical protein
MGSGVTGDVALLDADSVSTGWTVSVTETGNGNGGSAGAGADVTGFPGDLAGFDALALGDSIFANQGNPQVASMVLLFTGLSNTATYDLLLYGSRANAQGIDQRWSLTKGTGGADVDHGSELNATTYVNWTSISPNSNGEIEVTISSPGPDTAGALALNFGSITEASNVALITSFTTDVDTASAGSPATLSWTINEPVDTLVLDDGNGSTTDLLPATTAGEGSLIVSPSETTTYSITAVRDGVPNVRSLIIIAGEAPQISAFSASSTFLQVGESTDLTWEVIGATSLTLDPGATDVSGTSMIAVSPSEGTTYTLTATNTYGSSTADILVEVFNSPIPINRSVASAPANASNLWRDQVGSSDWAMSNAVLNSPLLTPSANTNITAAYTTGGGTSGGATSAFQYPELTTEIWFRPGVLSADHQVIFETGGGQNGLSALITESEIRFLGTSNDVRTLDVTIPTAGLNLGDFVQLVITNDSATDAFTASVRDTFGAIRTVEETADVTVGVNGSGLFIWAAGGIGGAEFNLGGRTDPDGTSPAGLSGFGGEIAIVNVYDRILSPADIGAAFDRVATIGVGPAGLQVTDVLFNDSSDELTITWNSISGLSYLVQFSTSLQESDWFELAGPFTADSASTTEVLSLPANRSRFFVRVLTAAP